MILLKRNKLGRRWVRGLALLLVAWSLTAWLAAHGLIVQAGISRADALVVLSGSATFVERTQRAAQLHAEGRAPKIILTDDKQRGGWSSLEHRNPFFVERAAEELRRSNVPAERIEVIGATQGISGTYDEAVLLREYAVRHQMRSLLDVTSAYHSRRALWILRHTFGGTGIEICLDAVPPGAQTPTTLAWWWQPSGWQMVAGEYVKLVYYVLRYR